MALSESFQLALHHGHLSPLRQYILTDRTVSPEIRNNTLAIYYRGKRLLKLIKTPTSYEAAFDESYALSDCEPHYDAWAKQLDDLPKALNSNDETLRWLHIVPYAKAIMDRWFFNFGGLEREAQQQLVQENNRDGNHARATDYFFCDMERVEGDVIVDDTRRGLRFDLVGVHWPSTPAIRRQTSGRTLVIAEVKYGDGAHANDSGLIEHFRGLQSFVADPARLAALKHEMITAFEQKHQLGFIQCQHPLKQKTGFQDENAPIVWLLILVNHDPEKTALGAELRQLNQLQDSITKSMIRIQVATSTFMGYGLWDQSVFDLDVFLLQFKCLS